MAKRKAFLLRVDPAMLDALQRWADDDLRSLNGQIEFLLRTSLSKAGRKIKASSGSGDGGGGTGDGGGASGRAASGESTTDSTTQHPGLDASSPHPGDQTS